MFWFELFCAYFLVSLIFHARLFVCDCESDGELLAHCDSTGTKLNLRIVSRGCEGWPQNLQHLTLFRDNKLMETSDQAALFFLESSPSGLSHSSTACHWFKGALLWPLGSARQDQRLFTRV